MRPSIIVLGSGQPGRDYSPPLKDEGRIPGAAKAIGRELAEAGCDLVVFSSSADYVEGDVVDGYVHALGADGPGRVVVRTPQDASVSFATSGEAAKRIQIEPDPASDWETSYYGSMFEADGLVVIGGGRSTRIAGLIAVARRTPTVALACFGGGGSVVWQHLSKYRNDTTPDDLSLMGRPWGDGSARGVVRSVLAQRERREAAAGALARASRRGRTLRALSSLAGGAALVLAMVALILVYNTTSAATAISCLVVGPVLGAVGGALLRDAAQAEAAPVWSAMRGLGAGLLATTLYVASQRLANDQALDVESARRLLWLVLPLGIAAGYTFDLVYTRLRSIDVLKQPDA
jgi:hypothetical protein